MTASTTGTAEVSPVLVDLIEGALGNIRLEMDAVLSRTALSPQIKHQHDHFSMIMDNQARIVHGQFGAFLPENLERYTGAVADGDVFILSDPYICSGAISHINDLVVAVPVFNEGELVAWSAQFGHVMDIGGATAGSIPTDAHEIYGEGIRMPFLKLYDAGKLNEELLELITHNSRAPMVIRSDIMGLVSGCRTAESRIQELCRRFDNEQFMAGCQGMLDRTERAMRKLVREHVQEKPQTFEDYIDDDGLGNGPFKVVCTIRREGDRAIIDFEGTDPAAPGPINFYLNEHFFKIMASVFLVQAYDPQIALNDGMASSFEIRVPEGSLVQPKFPAALGCRTHLLGRVGDVLAGALASQTPEAIPAAGFSSSPHLIYSYEDDDGEPAVLFEILFGGVPGRPFGDGHDGHSMWPDFASAPVEFLEAYHPFVIEEYTTIADSGGAGYHRGGNGVRRVYRFLKDGECSIHDDRWLTYPWGVNGGMPGSRSSKLLEHPDGTTEVLPSKVDHVQVQAGDRLHFIIWGGGGWGNPLDREPERVRLDVARGLVTPEWAQEAYGVVLVKDGTDADAWRVDEQATAQARERLSGEREQSGPFNFGPPLDEILANALEETGLPAPRPVAEATGPGR